MRRFVRVLTSLTVLALAVTTAAAAGNGGLAPVSPASPDAKNIRDIYWLILGITGGIFLLVIVTLLLFVVRYRSKGRPREVEGSQVRGHTNLELAWTAGPVILLAIIAGFVFWKVSDIGASSSLPASAQQAKDEITIEGHQYYWNFTYPNGAISVDRLRLPLDRTVHLTIRSADVDHSWWIPALGGKLDAIPGKTNHLTLRATKLGVFPGQCAEFCGLLHAAMLAHAEVLQPAAYDAWVSARANAQLALGKETFVGVCAKCHGLAAQGGVGPNIAQNPLLGDKKGLSNIIRHGTGQMPAVGNDWSQAQLDATMAYLQQRFKQGASGGSQG
ncbi:MAG TPA: cytochrome c oxidase subunit II [Gaiellaceae bacterium]|nr:cytochrome c oxidase subunit II [Gaiellaceae bacterium]